HLVHATPRAIVAVVEGLCQQRPVPQQTVVDRPRVDADALDRGLTAHRVGEARHDTVEEGVEIPVQAVLVLDRSVGEARDELQVDPSLVDPADHDPAAGRAQVDGSERARARGHRRKAAATPESTGMCRPVVRESSGPVSTYTASATFSGTTSRLRMVRFA